MFSPDTSKDQIALLATALHTHSVTYQFQLLQIITNSIGSISPDCLYY